MSKRPLLMIPGPIEFEPEVLNALGQPTASHVAPDFIETFGQCIERMRETWQSPSGQPFIIAGSGTLAMDIPAANLVEPGDNVLVLSTGYFGDRYADLLKRYGAEVTLIQAPPGSIVEKDKIEIVLKNLPYKLMTATHVDTSTAVRMDPEIIGELGQKHGVLTVLDGVCSVGGEELYMEKWGIDVAFTASQKAIGVPPGLALVMAGPKAINAWKKRKTPVANYYADWANWLPIMEAYEARKPSYFGTPPVNHICALNVSLKQILDEGLKQRWKRHKEISKTCKQAVKALGMKQVPQKAAYAATTMTAPYYPEGVTGLALLPQIAKAGAVFAGGLHPEFKNEYFRIGHMGKVTPEDIQTAIKSLKTALASGGQGAFL